MNCRQADFIGYSIFLEIFLEMLFLIAFGVPKKSVFTRLFDLFASASLANFQDRLVMTASITLRVIARRGLRSGSASAESAAWFIGEADITLRVCYLIVFFLAFRILDRDHLGQVFYRSENGVF